jgi:acetyl esterase
MPDDSQLDPEVAAALQMAEEMAVPPVQALSVEGARARLDDLFAAAEGPDVDAVEEFPIGGPDGGISTRLYLPDDDTLDEGDGPPVLVFYHGGGWVTGSLDTHDNVCRYLCDGSGVAVLSVDYRLAPEHPFPAALHDARAAYRWAREFGHRVNVDPERVAVGGDSAGGNLAAAVSLYERDGRDGMDFGVADDDPVPLPDHQLLIYPAVASAAVVEFDSYDENAEGYLLERASAEWYYERYVQDPAHRHNGYLAPLLADDHAGLPPATVVTAGFDPLRDEGQAYAEALEDAGVETTLEHYPGQIHGFVSLTQFLSGAEAALDTLADHLHDAFA